MTARGRNVFVPLPHAAHGARLGATDRSRCRCVCTRRCPARGPCARPPAGGQGPRGQTKIHHQHKTLHLTKYPIVTPYLHKPKVGGVK